MTEVHQSTNWRRGYWRRPHDVVDALLWLWATSCVIVLLAAMVKHHG